MPVLDLRCDECGHLEVDAFEPEGGLPDYGNCIMCLQFNEEGKIGTMRQMLCAPNFNMKGGIASVKGRSGFTADGTKWEVVDRPRKYDAKTKTWGGEVG